MRYLLVPLMAMLSALPSSAMQWTTLNRTLDLGTGTGNQFGVMTGGWDSLATSLLEGRVRQPVPTADLVGLCAYLTVAPGSGDTRTVTPRRDTTSMTDIQISWSGDSDSGWKCDGQSVGGTGIVSYTGGTHTAHILFSATTNGGLADAKIYYVALWSMPDDNEWFLCGGNNNDDLTANPGSPAYNTLAGTAPVANETVEFNAESIIGTGCTVKDLRVRLIANLGTGDWRFVIRENILDTALDITFAAGEGLTIKTDTSSYTSSAGDSIVMEAESTSVSTSSTTANFCVTVSSDTQYRYWIPSSVRENLTTGTRYWTPAGGGPLSSATESDVHLYVMRLSGTASAMYVEQGSGSGLGSYTYTLRQDGADTDITCGTGTSCNDTGTAVLQDQDLLSIKSVSSGGPSTPVVHFSILMQAPERRIW